MGLLLFSFFHRKLFLSSGPFSLLFNTSTILKTHTMLKSFVNLGQLLSILVQPQTSNIIQEEKPELFHFLKVVASEELDKLDAWDSDDISDESDVDETMIQIPRISSDLFLGPKKTIKKVSPKTSTKKLPSVEESQEVIRSVLQDGMGQTSTCKGWKCNRN